MKIKEFIELKRGNWERLEELLALIKRKRLSSLAPEEVREFCSRYRRAASELAFAQTYFPGTRITLYLNQLVARAYHYVYQPRLIRWRAIVDFFRDGYPRCFRKNLAYFLVSAVLFLASSFLGFIAVRRNEAAAAILLPDRLVDKVEAGEMWTEEIFSVFPPAYISSRIFTNNISVTFFSFGLGILAGMGTIYILCLNGLLLGLAAGLCSLYGMSGEFWAFVTPHGLLEISLIFIAGAAGLMLGDAWLSPGDYTRRESLRRKGKEAVGLIVGGIPFMIAAGLVEGYVSPSPVLAPALKVGLGILMAAAFYVYLLAPRRSVVPTATAAPGS